MQPFIELLENIIDAVLRKDSSLQVGREQSGFIRTIIRFPFPASVIGLQFPELRGEFRISGCRRSVFKSFLCLRENGFIMTDPFDLCPHTFFGTEP